MKPSVRKAGPRGITTHQADILPLNGSATEDPKQVFEPAEVWEGHTNYIATLAVLPDGSVVSGSRDTTLRRWDPKSGQCIGTWKGHTHGVRALVVLPDGSVVSGSRDTTLRRWDPTSGRCMGTWEGHTAEVKTLLVLPDGSVLSGGVDRVLRRWDPTSGRCVETWEGHRGDVKALALLRDGSVVSGGGDNTIRMWDPTSGEELGVWRGHTKSVEALVVLPHGPVVSASYDSTLRRWDPDSGRCVGKWDAHTGSANTLALLPDGTVMSGGEDAILRQWDATSQVCLGAWKEHKSYVFALALLPDGSVISGGNDFTLQRWRTVKHGCPPEASVCRRSITHRVDKAKLLENTLSIVDWSDTKLPQTHILELAAVLTMNHSLRILRLEDSGLTTEAVHSLCRVLAAHRGIQRLILDENPLGVAGLEALLTLFESHDTLYKVTAAEVGGMKTQRKRLKALNKKYKFRKGSSPVDTESSGGLPSCYYDRAWGGTQVMAEPVFYSAMGRVVEKERLSFYGTNDPLAELSVSLPMVKAHIRKMVSKLQPQAWHDGTVYLPQAWQQRVLDAIKDRREKALVKYWQNHPSLVTRQYEVEGVSNSLPRLLMAIGTASALSQWLALYGMYQSQCSALPPVGKYFSDVMDGEHALHFLINCVPARKQEPWYSQIKTILDISGDIYHGLVHMHSANTTEADKRAVASLNEQDLWPMAVDDAGYTPLMRALMEEKYTMATLLLPHSELAAVDKEGNTLLHHVIKARRGEHRHQWLVKLLACGVDVTAVNQAGKTAQSLLKAEGSVESKALLRVIKTHRERYVERLEKTIALFVSRRGELDALKATLDALEKGGKEAETWMEAALSDDKVPQKACEATRGRLRQLFFAPAFELASAEAMKGAAKNRVKVQRP